MKQYKTLWEGKYTRVISPLDDSYEIFYDGDNAYVYIIPVLGDKIGIRYEYCPPYLVHDETGKEGYYTIMSGGMESGESIEEAVVRELLEEGGVKLLRGKISYLLNNIPVMKSTTLRANVVLVQAVDYELESPKGDGTFNEKISRTVWVTRDELKELVSKPNKDLLLYFVYLVLLQTSFKL